MLRLFIGANNETGEVEIEKLRTKVLDRWFTGYTIVESLGCWKGGQEKSVIVEVMPEGGLLWTVKEIKALCDVLKRVLKQEAIGVQQVAQPINFY